MYFYISLYQFIQDYTIMNRLCRGMCYDFFTSNKPLSNFNNIKISKETVISYRFIDKNALADSCREYRILLCID